MSDEINVYVTNDDDAASYIKVIVDVIEGPQALADLNDVAITDPQAGDALTYDGTEWINAPAATGSGDVAGPASSVDGNFAAFDGLTGKLIKDSGTSPASFATAAQGGLADTAVQPLDIADFETTTELNGRDAANRDRENHTGTQLSNTISDFADTVRGVVLTGLSTVSSVVIAATDTVIEAFGKLQAQLTELAGNVLQKDNETAYTPTEDYHPATKKYVDDSAQTAADVSIETALDGLDAANVQEFYDKFKIMTGVEYGNITPETGVIYYTLPPHS
jgi:hypothetical protein